MNIFYISDDPKQAAEWMVDRHVVKMILESAQLLSTAHRVLDGEEFIGKTPTGRNVKRWRLSDSREHVVYQATHVNHPSAVWTRASVENYNWLVDHFFALMNEYTHRYGKRHKCQGDLSYMLQSPPKNLEDWDMTKMPSAMAEEYIISDDPLTNYRNYYKVGKSRMHKWTNRPIPDWIENEQRRVA
jgi:hypothetical protein